MALRAKVRGRTRLVSKAMARVFARKGIAIVDTEAVTAPVAPKKPVAPVVQQPPVRQQRAAPPHVAPATKPADAPLTLEFVDGKKLAAEAGISEAQIDAFVTRKITDASDAFDLTDEELEALTAPTNPTEG